MPDAESGTDRDYRDTLDGLGAEASPPSALPQVPGMREEVEVRWETT